MAAGGNPSGGMAAAVGIQGIGSGNMNIFGGGGIAIGNRSPLANSSGGGSEPAFLSPNPNLLPNPNILKRDRFFSADRRNGDDDSDDSDLEGGVIPGSGGRGARNNVQKKKKFR